MASPDDFRRTLDEAREGRGVALGELFRDLYPRVLRYLRALAPAEAENLASDTWLDVATALELFDGDRRALRAFAFTAARHRLVDHMHSRAGRSSLPARPDEEASVRVVDEEPMAGVAKVAAPAIDPELATEAALRRIAALPGDQAEVLLLTVLGELAVEDVARIVGKRVGTVRVLQHRALLRLFQPVAQERVAR